MAAGEEEEDAVEVGDGDDNSNARPVYKRSSSEANLGDMAKSRWVNSARNLGQTVATRSTWLLLKSRLLKRRVNEVLKAMLKPFIIF